MTKISASGLILLIGSLVSVVAFRNHKPTSTIRPLTCLLPSFQSKDFSSHKLSVQSNKNVFSSPAALSTSASSVAPLLSAVSATASATTESSKSNLINTLKIGGLFGLWYVLNIGYNVYNKKVLNMVPNLVYTVALLQLLIGWLYVLPVWALKIRAAPQLSGDEVQSLLPIAVLHSLTHLGAVVSLSAGAVSFTHIVKAAEPAVSAGISALFFQQYLPWQVYASLIPVMGGVALASAKELSFTWLSFSAAMVSNVASAMRGIVGKKTMTKPIGKNMDAANVYGVMTILSTFMCLPVAWWLEGKHLTSTVQALVQAGKGKALLTQTLLSGLFYYLYNEVAFLALDNVAPVTHAIGNTIKRVVIIVASVFVFKTPMSLQGVVGSTIAILGVLLYSLAKNTFK